MQTSTVPRVGAGHFQWNAGGWFGGAFGSASWMMVVAGFLVAYRQFWLAAVVAGCCLVTIAVAWALWARRDRLNPFRGLMCLLGLTAITIPVAWFATYQWGSPDALSRMNWPSPSIYHAIVPLVAPVFMAWFFVLERSAKRLRAN